VFLLLFQEQVAPQAMAEPYRLLVVQAVAQVELADQLRSQREQQQQVIALVEELA